jgi:hypothetical protein
VSSPRRRELTLVIVVAAFLASPPIVALGQDSSIWLVPSHMEKLLSVYNEEEALPFSKPDSVMCYCLADTITRSDRVALRSHGLPIRLAVGRLKAEHADKLDQLAFHSEFRYGWGKGCISIPDVAFVFMKGDASAVLTVCIFCRELWAHSHGRARHAYYDTISPDVHSLLIEVTDDEYIRARVAEYSREGLK